MTLTKLQWHPCFDCVDGVYLYMMQLPSKLELYIKKITTGYELVLFSNNEMVIQSHIVSVDKAKQFATSYLKAQNLINL